MDKFFIYLIQYMATNNQGEKRVKDFIKKTIIKYQKNLELESFA